VYRGKSLDLYSEYTVDAGKQGVLMFLQVCEVRPCNLIQEEFLLAISHSLHDKPLVCAEKEKASRSATCLACFENVGRVCLGVQRLEEGLAADTIT